MSRIAPLLALAVALLFAACAGPKYEYKPVPGRTGVVRQNYAFPPEDAPPVVKAAIEAGNRITGLPYKRGGGHRIQNDVGYDCSGSVSYVLREAGLMTSSMPSGAFRKYGESGEGKWISIYAKSGHVFMVVAGMRFDTGWNNARQGPRWTTLPRPAGGAVVRHPKGL